MQVPITPDRRQFGKWIDGAATGGAHGADQEKGQMTGRS
jgi:hypothetical protein